MLHGLWQPVATLRALSLALTEGWSTHEEADRLELARRIERETERLRDVVEDLTTLGTVDGDGFVPTIRAEAVVELLRDAAGAVEELDGRLRVALEPDAGAASVLADRGRVLQVLKTFLRKADRSSGEGVKVTLRAELEEREVRFIVAYPGDDPSLPGVFDLGAPERAPGSDAPNVPGAVRMRMYLAHRLIEAQGGWVDARSEAGSSSISFGLPAADGTAT